MTAARSGTDSALSAAVPDIESLKRSLDGADYLADDGLATALFLSLRLPQPLLLEGEAGVGKTEAGKALAEALGTELMVLILGDQPGVTPDTVRALVAGCDEHTVLAACLYDDGRGHPLAFGRALFEDLRDLHGDKAVWKLMDRRADDVREVRVPGPVPPDVDTWDDYEALIAAAAPAA